MISEREFEKIGTYYPSWKWYLSRCSRPSGPTANDW